MLNTHINKPPVFIFDIDGTLASHEGIRGPFEEHKVGLDKPIEPVWAVLNALSSYGFRIIFLSGRTEGCRDLTEDWLKQYMAKPQVELYMRKSGDYRKDSIIKHEIYDAFLLPQFNIVGVFDDRLQVCRMLYENNIFCFNVNQGLKEF